MKNYTKYKISSKDKKNIYRKAINIIQQDTNKFMCISIASTIANKYKIHYNEAKKYNEN